MANKLQELFQKRAQLAAAAARDPLAEVDAAIRDAERAAKAEADDRRAAALADRTKALAEVEEEILALVEQQLTPLLERRQALFAEMAPLGNGWPVTSVPPQLVNAPRLVAEVRSDRRALHEEHARILEHRRQHPDRKPEPATEPAQPLTTRAALDAADLAQQTAALSA